MTASRSRILVVDDEPLNRRLIQAILAPEGYEITHAADGEQALALVEGETFDLVLLDVMMPGLDGIEVCRRMRAALGPLALPIVMISALTDPASRTRGKRAGADDFLTKPIHEDELLVRVRNLLLVRDYHMLHERQRLETELEMRSWRLISMVAAALAGCLDHQSVIAALHRQLATELLVESAAIYEGDDRALLAISSSTDPPAEHCELRIAVEKGPVHVFAFGRATAFTPAERRLFDDLAPHLANAVATVRSHHRSQTVLRASEERHRILFDASPLPIWVFDPKTLAIVAANDAMIQILGYSRDELLAMRLPDLKPPSAHPQLVAGMASAFPGRRTHVGTLQYRCKDGRFVEFDVTSHATIVDGALMMVTVGIDVTHAHAIEEQLRQSQKMDAVGRLAGGVAHDFNNMLGAIIGTTELAIEDLGPRNAVTPDLEEVLSAAHRAAELTRQLLTFSRQQKRTVSKLALGSVVASVEKMLSRIVGEDIDMSTVIEKDLGTVEGDRGQLEQVLLNLVVNARDAMPRGGRLRIEARNVELDACAATVIGLAAGYFVMLVVSDTGCGMDAATRERAFEPFFTTKEVGKGTGLGLATVFGIVSQSAGAIAVESEVGVGTTFHVYLPRIEGPSTTRVIARRPPVAGANGRRVLLVEDDERLRRVICRQLASWGYVAVAAPDAATALALLPTIESIDLVLTDLVMPGIDGCSLADEIVAQRPGTKILFMSGYSQHAAIKSALNADDQFIEKPFTAHELSAAIARALNA